jgi:hypothetical protein
MNRTLTPLRSTRGNVVLHPSLRSSCSAPIAVPAGRPKISSGISSKVQSSSGEIAPLSNKRLASSLPAGSCGVTCAVGFLAVLVEGTVRRGAEPYKRERCGVLYVTLSAIRAKVQPSHHACSAPHHRPHRHRAHTWHSSDAPQYPPHAIAYAACPHRPRRGLHHRSERPTG